MMRSIISCMFLVLGPVILSHAQTDKRIIQLSGIIMSSDTTGGALVGVSVYVPKAGRGDQTNSLGYFSFPAQVTDSVVIRRVGYKSQHYIIPKTANDYHTILIEMVEDTTYLQPVVITAIPTEEVFKEAVLALDIPFDESMSKENLNEKLLALMVQTTPMDASQNYRYYIDQWSQRSRDSFQPRVNPFLNPFNWARFIRTLRRSKQNDDK